MRLLQSTARSAAPAALLLSLVASPVARPGAAATKPGASGPRAAWTSSKLAGSPEPPPPYKIVDAYPKQRFSRPIQAVSARGDDRLFVGELGGKIWSFPDRADAEGRDLFCDLSRREGWASLYSLAFHPRYPDVPQVFVMYVVRDGSPDGSHVSRLTVIPSADGAPARCDLASEQILITWFAGGHNGSDLQFGRDGYLYISTGDGTAPFPPDRFDVGQSLSDLLSAVLRIDVDHPDPKRGKPYSIPKDNPFVGNRTARPEIWSYGYRNPWRMSPDPTSDAMWIGDVGWETWEMIFRAERGSNGGWSVMEGPMKLRPDARPGPTPITLPVASHPHHEARSITGGLVYQGRELPELAGAYVYGDFESGKIWGLRYDAAAKKVTWQAELAEARRNLVAFGVDHRGELLVVDYGGATGARDFSAAGIHRLVKSAPEKVAGAFPRQLGRTGLFAATRGHRLAPGVVEYQIASELWADGATARRFVAIPGRDQVTFDGDGRGAWKLPPGSVLGKTLFLGARPVETQILLHEPGDVRGYTYRWNDAGSDAELVGAAGATATFEVPNANAAGGPRGSGAPRTWKYASRAECLTCHNQNAGPAIAFHSAQLDRQLEGLFTMGLFARRPAQARVTLVDPRDAAQPLERRARSYLHANCAHCHRFGAGGSTGLDLQIDNPLERTRAVDARPAQGAFGLTEPAIVRAGDPFRSVLLYRVSTLGSGRMPRLGSHEVDEQAVALLEEWIRALPPVDTAAPPLKDELYAQATTAATALRRMPEPGQIPRLAEALLRSPSGALMLARALGRGEVPGPAASPVIEQGNASDRPEIRGLFERFLPAERRVPRLGESIDGAALLALPGDATRGRRLFEGSAGCLNCHRPGNAQSPGGLLGPDLSQVAARLTRDKLLESLLEPSRTIDPKYAPYALETTDGEAVMGVLLERGPDGVTIIDARNTPVKVAQVKIKSLLPTDTSLMPAGLLAALTAQEAADLLAYLASLK
jgi:putative heme-binding domain-containing protein